jgi:toxin ParE1/3/4
MARLRLSALAQADIAHVLSWTEQRRGDRARERYEQLLSSALRDLAVDPLRLGTVPRPELGEGVRSYHLRSARKQAGVARPRHLILYRISGASTVEVGRVLHDAMELERHATFDLPREP